MPAYIKFDGIDGEVTEAAHRTWMDVFSFSFGASNTGSGGGGGGGGGGVVHFSEFNFVKPTGKGSPTLLLKCCNGAHIPRVVFELTRSGPGQGNPVYLKYEFQDVMVTSYQIGGDNGGAVPVESLSINFREVKYTQAVPGGIEEMHWDIANNHGGGGQSP